MIDNKVKAKDWDLEWYVIEISTDNIPYETPWAVYYYDSSQRLQSLPSLSSVFLKYIV